MESKSEYNQDIIFERTENWNIEETTVTYRMLSVLALIDGKRSLLQIERNLEISSKDLDSDIEIWQALGIVQERIEDDQLFFKDYPEIEKYYSGPTPFVVDAING